MIQDIKYFTLKIPKNLERLLKKLKANYYTKYERGYHNDKLIFKNKQGFI